MLTEGRHRQVRKLCERSGLLICKLRRVRLGPLELGALKMRWCRPLSWEEVAACYRVALPAEPPAVFDSIDDCPEAYLAARTVLAASNGSVVPTPVSFSGPAMLEERADEDVDG